MHKLATRNKGNRCVYLYINIYVYSHIETCGSMCKVFNYNIVME